MNQSSRKREMAKILYIKNGYTQAQIADLVGVSLPTMNRWVKKYDWKRVRSMNILGKEETLARMYEQVAELHEAIQKRPKGKRYADTKEADILVKLGSAIEKIESQASVSVSGTLKVILEIADWLFKQGKREELIAFLDTTDLYVNAQIDPMVEED